jgi:hypothetical protein
MEQRNQDEEDDFLGPALEESTTIEGIAEICLVTTKDAENKDDLLFQGYLVNPKSKQTYGLLGIRNFNLVVD